MSEEENPKHFDLEDRTFGFAQCTRQFIKTLAKTIANIETRDSLLDLRVQSAQITSKPMKHVARRTSFLRIKYCRKEAKESRYWLRLLDTEEGAISKKRDVLVQEAQELMNIFGAIVRKSE
jgi:hypothetical protein